LGTIVARCEADNPETSLVTVLDVISDGVKIGLGSLLTILGTWLGSRRESHRRFGEQRVEALRGVVQMCDFLLAAQGKRLGGQAGTDWNLIRSENLSYGGLLPESVQEPFQSVLREVLMKDYWDDKSSVNPADLETLRERCLNAIQKEFGK
jgi:hypothetical protein